jgi:hypothetical protein
MIIAATAPGSSLIEHLKRSGPAAAHSSIAHKYEESIKGASRKNANLTAYESGRLRS